MQVGSSLKGLNFNFRADNLLKMKIRKVHREDQPPINDLKSLTGHKILAKLLPFKNQSLHRYLL